MVEEVKLKKPEKWDKKWRIVIFDIPNKKKPARNTLTEKLKKLGFYHLQKAYLSIHLIAKKKSIS
jgi:DNA-binding transcriptional regulator PaaX